MTNLNSENTVKVSQQDSCIISEINLSTATGSVENTNLEFEPVSWDELCNNLKNPPIGEKEGSYICVGKFNNNYRKAINVKYPHNCFILDGDSSLIDGIAVKGAPDPVLVHEALKELNLQHVIFSTHSNKSVNSEYHRYRVLIPAFISSKDTLEACINWVIAKLHGFNVMLENVAENMTQGIPWYLPRVTKNNKDDYYLAEYSIGCAAFPIQEAINQLSVNKYMIASKSKANQGCNIPLQDVINGVPDGCRNIMVFKYACHLKGRGLLREEVESLVIAAADNCNPPLGREKAIEKIESAYSYSDDLLSTVESLHEVKNIPLDELGNTTRLIIQYGDVIRYPSSSDDYNIKNWLVYDGLGWHQNIDGSAERLALKVVDSIAGENRGVYGKDELERHVKRSRKVCHVKNILEGASWKEEVKINVDDVDNDPMLIGTLNGVVDLETGEIIQNSKEYFSTKRVNTSFNKEAECPNWDRFLKRITGENQDMIKYLNLLISYLLTGKTNEHKLFIIHGSGSNGKTTWVRCIQEILGEYASQIPVESLSYTKSNAIDDNLSRTKGSRLTVTSEIKRGARLNEPLVKQLTGGDKITAREMHKGSLEYKPTSKFIMVVNDLPEITGSDSAMAKRVKVIPFSQVIHSDEEDKYLADKLRGEYDAIFTRAVLMCPEWRQFGLIEPNKIVEASSDYVESKDVFKQWKNESFITNSSSEDFVGSDELMKSHRAWCNERSLNALDVNTFYSRLKDCTGVIKSKKTTAGVQVRGYKGIKLAV
jgi:P4 family phage/plasmid primase-like protien